jgi:uncharacterized protein YjeT (DUF2065 family)
MSDLWVALALVMVIEGALYALFPDGMKRVMAMTQDLPSHKIRWIGLGAAMLGFALVWMVRGF